MSKWGLELPIFVRCPAKATWPIGPRASHGLDSWVLD